MRHIFDYRWLGKMTEVDVPASDGIRRSKVDALIEEGTLNPSPERSAIQSSRTADSSIRAISSGQVRDAAPRVGRNASVTDAADEYGVSRPTYYQAKADFDEAGIARLVPKKRGPRGPHKLQSEVLAFLETQVIPGEPIRARELAKLVRSEFGLDVHPRTIERALGGKKTAR